MKHKTPHPIAAEIFDLTNQVGHRRRTNPQRYSWSLSFVLILTSVALGWFAWRM